MEQDKFISVRLFGGLGNQIFQYMAGKWIASERNLLLYVDTSWLQDGYTHSNSSISEFQFYKPDSEFGHKHKNLLHLYSDRLATIAARKIPIIARIGRINAPRSAGYEDFTKVMDVNVTGTWLANRAVTPYMKEKNKGAIINLASALGLVGFSNRTPYASSKGAVVQMTRALAIELAPWNITVNAICPGPFLTEMNLPIAGTEEGEKFIVGATALGRWGELKEIQGAAIFLASDAATYLVGSMLTVDGGWTAR